MVALHVYFVSLVVSVDTAHGEIPNEIRQYVLSLLKEHDGEVIELKQKIRTLRQEVSSLQSSHLRSYTNSMIYGGRKKRKCRFLWKPKWTTKFGSILSRIYPLRA